MAVEPQIIRIDIRDQADGSLTFAGDLTVWPWHLGGRAWGDWLGPVAREWVGRTRRDPSGRYRAVASESGRQLAEITFDHNATTSQEQR